MSSQKVRSRKSGPESWKMDGPRKEICKCCRKELGLFRGNIAMFRGKCLSCQQKICPGCVANNYCHKCSIRHSTKLEPTDLMQLSGKRLLEISSTLHFHNPQGYEKAELVEVILAIYGKKWKRPIPPEPSAGTTTTTTLLVVGTSEAGSVDASDSEDENASRNGGLPAGQRQSSLPSRSSSHALADLPESPNHSNADINDIREVTIDGPDGHPPVSAIFSSSSSTTTSSPDGVGGIRTDSSSSTTSPSVNTPDGATDSMDWVDGVAPAPSETAARPPPVSRGHDDLTDDEASPGMAARTLVNQTGGAEPDAVPDLVLDQAALDAISSLHDVAEVATIRQLKVHQLKSILHSHGVDFEGCCEKWDLADRVTALWLAGRAEDSNGRDQPSDDASQTDERAEAATRREPVEDDATQVPTWEETTSSNATASQSGPRVYLRSDVPNLLDLQSPEAIQQLSVLQLKMLLQKNSVHYTGCLERSELAGRVSELWNEAKKRESTEDISEDEVCKICMDAFIDCVLLECGHMVSCTECGRQMSECPICRQYVVRVVHTFKV